MSAITLCHAVQLIGRAIRPELYAAGVPPEQRAAVEDKIRQRITYAARNKGALKEVGGFGGKRFDRPAFVQWALHAYRKEKLTLPGEVIAPIEARGNATVSAEGTAFLVALKEPQDQDYRAAWIAAENRAAMLERGLAAANEQVAALRSKLQLCRERLEQRSEVNRRNAKRPRTEKKT